MQSGGTQWTARIQVYSSSENSDDATPSTWLLADSTELTFGREATCQITVDEIRYPAVSRHHAKIQPVANAAQIQWQICDLNSVNGTYINGIRLRECQVLQNGDRIQLTREGPEFLFECQTPATVIPTEPPNSAVHISTDPLPSSPGLLRTTSAPTAPPLLADDVPLIDRESITPSIPRSLWTLPAATETHHFAGHTDTVRTLAFSPEGTRLASGSTDKSIKIWDLQSKQELQTFNGHKLPVTAIAFSPNGEIFASGSADKLIKQWDVSTGNERSSWLGHGAGITAIAFSPDGKTLASGSADKTIKLWDIETGEIIQTLGVHKMPITAIAFSPNGQTLVSSGGDRLLKFWNLHTESEPSTLSVFRLAANALVFSPDAQILAIGSDDKTIRLWDFNIEQEVYVLPIPNWQTGSLAISFDGQWLAGGTADYAIRLWKV